MKRESKLAYKRSFVLTHGQRLSFIWAACCHAALSCYPPAQIRDYSDGQPSVAGLHALSPSATHTLTVTSHGRELLPHVLTLTPQGAVIFFCVAVPSRALPD